MGGVQRDRCAHRPNGLALLFAKLCPHSCRVIIAHNLNSAYGGGFQQSQCPPLGGAERIRRTEPRSQPGSHLVDSSELWTYLGTESQCRTKLGTIDVAYDEFQAIVGIVQFAVCQQPTDPGGVLLPERELEAIGLSLWNTVAEPFSIVLTLWNTVAEPFSVVLPFSMPE